jgi:hypothetical protein
MSPLRPICAAALWTVAVCLTALGIGCSSNPGPAPGEVQGKVTFKGTPVTEGTITFLNSKDGGGGEGKLGPDGMYTVPNKLNVGEYVVIVTPPMQMTDTDPGKSPPAPVEKNVKNVPPKYRQQGTTPLKFKVESGPNTANFDLTP